MKAIMISVKPEYVEKILNGEKIGELRTTIPKCELPYKAYLYCTKGQELWGDGTGETWNGIDENEDIELVYEYTPTLSRLNGKVVAEWTVKEYDKYTDLTNTANLQRIYKRCCVNYKNVWEYSKQGTKPIYDLHIDDLKIYDKPKELSEFYKWGNCPHYYSDYEDGCCAENCPFYDKDFCNGHSLRVKRPPQSWFYVEELKGE